ncbi:TetR/AcrR family transcriptional regulator [Glycomyces xiaoerkulensis]|uniref:TetR/AcrR family transcriptional regulator n=1 Tax=Glycomyces xiaoerkulensis TaxID=2038139 RepID=UPI000C257857|nr:TetR/AcrR family transcriptional regulator [Glycomyces xiaoerkulensis]
MSVELPEPGTVRPGGRTARVRSAVLRAAAEALVDRGFGRIDLPDIARRAEVGKTTVYRRWGSVAGVVADLLAEMASDSEPRADTGSLGGDLAALAHLIRRTFADPLHGPLFKAVIAAATCDAEAAEALGRFYRTRAAEWEPCIERARERGEVPAGTDAAEVIEAVSGPLYYRLLATGKPVDPAAADRAAAAALEAAAAGIFSSTAEG